MICSHYSAAKPRPVCNGTLSRRKRRSKGLDLVFLGRHVRAGGIIFADDYQLPAVARAVSFCVTNLNWTIEEVSAADNLHRWAVLRTSAKADTRPFDYYVEF